MRTLCLEGAALLGSHAHEAAGTRRPASGADFLICPDNTVHAALPEVLPRSPLPWLHIAQVVAAEARERGFRRLGLTGTRWLLASEVYPRQLAAVGIDCLRPGGEEADAMNRIIMDELVFRPSQCALCSR